MSSQCRLQYVHVHYTKLNTYQAPKKSRRMHYQLLLLFSLSPHANLINGPDESAAIYCRYKFFANEFTPVQNSLL